MKIFNLHVSIPLNSISRYKGLLHCKMLAIILITSSMMPIAAAVADNFSCPAFTSTNCTVTQNSVTCPTSVQGLSTGPADIGFLPPGCPPSTVFSGTTFVNISWQPPGDYPNGVIMCQYYPDLNSCLMSQGITLKYTVNNGYQGQPSFTGGSSTQSTAYVTITSHSP